MMSHSLRRLGPKMRYSSVPDGSPCQITILSKGLPAYLDFPMMLRAQVVLDEPRFPTIKINDGKLKPSSPYRESKQCNFISGLSTLTNVSGI